MATITTEEQGTVAIPHASLMQDGRLVLYPEVVGSNLFSIRYNKGELVFQAGGFIGVIPINSEISIDVRPKHPIQNLQRMLQISGVLPKILSGQLRRYQADGDDAGTWLHFLGKQFLTALQQVRREGLYKRYEREVAVSTIIRGRILLGDTIKRRARGGLCVATAQYQRTADIAENQSIRFALRVLHERLARSESTQEARLSRELLGYDRFLSGVEARRVSDEILNQLVLKIPHSRAGTLSALALSKVIVSRSAVSVLGLPSQGFMAAPVVIDTADAFERYVRNVLAAGVSGFRIVDGNMGPPRGGMRTLLTDDMGRPIGSNATPDLLVFERDGDLRRASPLVVGECKYKTFEGGQPDRAAVNQVLAYALSYGAKLAVVICPAAKPEFAGIRYLGHAGDVALLVFAMDLGADMQRSEVEAVSAWNRLLTSSTADVPRNFMH